jgi:hypothetical protein
MVPAPRIDPEWQRQADVEPYRTASHWGAFQERPQWFFVYDCRVDDAAPIKRFARRQDAEAYAAKLNAVPR